MDTRTARRAAEKAARDLMNSRAALIGELAVASAERDQLDAAVTAAGDRGRQLVTAAQDEADQLLATAQAHVRDANQRYADLYNAATTSGWAPADLSALGFPSSLPGARRRRTTPGSEPAAVASPSPTI